MRAPLAVLFVFLAACPAPGRELLTRNKTPVYREPSKSSRVLGHLSQNVKVSSDKRKDFWFHVSAEIGGRALSGWVNQVDVTTTMGRSKGQLLAENERLYSELVELRSTKGQLLDQLKQTREELKAALKKAEDDLAAAGKEISRLRASLKEARGSHK